MPAVAGEPIVLRVIVDPTGSESGFRIITERGEQARQTLEKPVTPTVRLASLADMEKELQRLSARWKEVAVGSEEYLALQQKIPALTKQISQLTTGQNRMAVGGNAARMALLQMSYAAQDASYGVVNFRMMLMGISNNLNLLPQLFIMAAQEAKGFGMTLQQSLIKAIMGPGGLILAFSLAMGAVQAFLFAMKSTSTEAKEASADLNRFTSELKALSMSGIMSVIASLDAQIVAARKKRRALAEELASQPSAFAVGKVGALPISGISDQIKELDKIIEDTEKRRKDAEKEYQERLQGRFGIVLQLRAQIEDYNKQLNVQGLTERQIRGIVDARAKKEEELKNLTMTTAQWLEKQVSIAELGLKLGYYTTADVVERLQRQLAMTTDVQKRLEIEQKIHDTLIAESDLELKRQAAVKASGEARVKIEEDMFNQIQSLQNGLIEDEYAKRRRVEEQRHTQALANIEEEAARAGQISVGPTGERILTGEAANLVNLENVSYSRNRLRIERDFQYELGKIRAEGIADQAAKENALYQVELQHIQDTETNKELAEARINALRISHETRLADIQRNNFENMLSAGERLGSILADAFAGANSGAQKLVAMLRIAVEIARQINILQNLKPGESSVPSTLGLIGSFVSLIGLADEGAIVTRPSVVQVAQGGIPEAFLPLNKLPSIMPTIVDNSAVVKRLESLEKTIENMPPPYVIVKNPITLADGLKIEMPGYEKYANRKYVVPG